MNKYCVIAAVGESSLHQKWLIQQSKFDLHLLVYDSSYEKFKSDSLFVTQSNGYKFNLIFEYLNNHPDILERYDYFYMPDDDISISVYSIMKLFKCMKMYNLAVAQPAISNFYYSFPHTLCVKNSVIRYTSFVEIMQPCFSKEALKRVLFTFNGTNSGWGIDYHWGVIIDYTKMNMAILDCIKSIHTRPVRSDFHQELQFYMQKNNLSFDVYCG